MEDAKKLIGESIWNVGSNGTTTYQNILTSKYYEFERSGNTGKICTTGVYCNDTVERNTTWKGYIGLMYPSDYGYATSGGTESNRETCLNTVLYAWNNVSDCYLNDWLYKNDTTQWTMTPLAYSSRNSYVSPISWNGRAGFLASRDAMSISPVLFLKSNIRILDDGSDGSSSSPFKLSIGKS